MGGAMANEVSGIKLPIDLVYTYVDGDQAHAEKRKPYIASYKKGQLNAKEAHTRFLHVGEIRFSVRSALKYMPWLRRIFIVTDSQMPPVDNYLIKSGKVKIVDHRDIIPERYLPTFNIVAIESLLHRIEGLSEIFLYNNDDCMHFSSVAESAFVMPGDAQNMHLVLHARYVLPRRVMHLASRFLPSAYASVLANSYTQLHSNACRLLKNGPYNLHLSEILVPQHFTNIYRKSTALRIEDEFARQLDANRKHRFVIPGVFGYSTLAYTLEKKWHPGDLLCFPEYFGRRRNFKMYDFTALFSHENKLWRRISSSQLPFVCLNNIPQSGRTDFEQVMRAKGLGKPGDELPCDDTILQEAD